MEDNIKYDPDTQRLTCQKAWTLSNLPALEKKLKTIAWPQSGNILIDGRDLAQMDSAGAWLLSKYLKKLQQQDLKVQFEEFPKKYQTLLSLVQQENLSTASVGAKQSFNMLTKIGKYSTNAVSGWSDYLAFIGKLTLEAIRIILKSPKRIRWNAIANIIDKAGFQALPIIALLSFMIGIVLTYQMGVQLRNYGANVFVVDLLGLSVLREFGPLLTAIMISGRTGSSFTAQLGIMKINQEIDALTTLGVTPGELLLLPRIVGLVIALPLLTMWADMFGIMGGMFMANNMLDISWSNFLQRFEHEIPVRALLIGLGKAPVFALIIASVGCYEGMRVQSNATSLGRNTTRSVVTCIFFIIVVDAIFSILLSRLKL